MTIKVGDMCSPSADIIQYRYMKITMDPDDNNHVWTADFSLPRVSSNDTFMCIGFIRARSGLTTSDYDHNVDIAIVLHVQHKIITFLPAEECEVIL